MLAACTAEVMSDVQSGGPLDTGNAPHRRRLLPDPDAMWMERVGCSQFPRCGVRDSLPTASVQCGPLEQTFNRNASGVRGGNTVHSGCFWAFTRLCGLWRR